MREGDAEPLPRIPLWSRPGLHSLRVNTEKVGAGVNGSKSFCMELQQN